MKILPCSFNYLTDSEDWAEGIRFRVVNAGLEVSGTDRGQNVSPEAAQKRQGTCYRSPLHLHILLHPRQQLTELLNTLFSREALAQVITLAPLWDTYLVKLNLGYQILFFTKMVKFSASFRKAGL